MTDKDIVYVLYHEELGQFPHDSRDDLIYTLAIASFLVKDYRFSEEFLAAEGVAEIVKKFPQSYQKLEFLLVPAKLKKMGFTVSSGKRPSAGWFGVKYLTLPETVRAAVMRLADASPA